MASVNACAVDSTGNLKDASEIEFYNSETDVQPIGSEPVISRGKTSSIHSL